MAIDNLILWIAFFSFLSLILSIRAVISSFRDKGSTKVTNKANHLGVFKRIFVLNICKAFLKNFYSLKKLKKASKKITVNKKTLTKVKKQKQIAREKGISAELAIYRQLKSYFGKDRVFYNLYVERSSGDYAQIDILAITTIGIIVFEVKNYSGWIFANGKSRVWTKVLAYGKDKYHFYNPFFQNAGHIRALKYQFRAYPNLNFYSVIIFDGDCEIKSLNNLDKGCFLVYKRQLEPFLNKLMRSQVKIDYKFESLMAILSKFKRNSSDKNIVRAHLNKVKSLQKKE